MDNSRSSDVSNLSSFCSIESVKRNEENREKIRKRLPDKISVEHYLKTKDLPKWFRILSDSQLSAADSLTEAIRDDMNQNTTHRCQDILIRIGLRPMEPQKNIKFVIKLSRGNDLAFLWFLMELFYTDTCSECTHVKTEYNINQQLLMSTISHLDMVVTLRALDKIIPPRPKPEPRKHPPTPKPKKQTYLSPYLEPLPRPVIGPNLKKRPPRHVYPVLKRYAHYLDPSYIPPNEANRWYALPEEEQKLIDFGFTLPHESTAVVTKILKTHLKSMFLTTLNRKDIWKALCPTHLRLLKEENKQAKLEKIKKREEIKRHFCLKERKTVRSKKIAAQLEADAKRVQEERNEQLEYEELHTWMKCFINNLIWRVTTPRDEEEITCCPLNDKCPLKYQKGCPQSNKPICHCCCYLKCENENDEKPFALGHFGTPKPNEIYFQAAGQNKPYVFHYQNIFKDETTEKNDPVKNALSNALDLKNYENEDEAISSWMRKTWEEEVNNVNKERERKEHDETQKEQQIYDGRDRDLMIDMLYDAINILRKNPKYVLASLPEAYKLPGLLRWIIFRYCDAPFTKKEKKEALQLTTRLFEAVRKAKVDVIPPRNKDIGTRKIMSYVCRNYVKSKTHRKMQEYFHALITAYMEDVRVYAQLMEPFHCLTPPWTTFYSYLPAREYDIVPFKTWKVDEYMDAQKELEKRIKKKKFEEQFKI